MSQYTPDEIRAIRDGIAAGRSFSEIGRALGRDGKSIARRSLEMGWHQPRKKLTPEQLARIRFDYPDQRAEDLAIAMGLSLSTLRNAVHRLGLKKSAAFYESDRSARIKRGHQSPAMIAARFQKGLVPHNKGLRRPGWSPGRMSETQFKKGRPASESRNYLPVGSLRICADGYLERKVTDDRDIVPARRWVGVHRLVWEAAHGPIPAGQVVVFRPGRASTEESEITLDAIELVTRVELMRRNTIHNLPPELVGVIRLRTSVVRQINKRSRQHEEQD